MSLPIPDLPLAPADELVRACIDVLLADPILTGTMLYPDWSPRLSGDDVRIYSANVELPPELRPILPRILLETTQYPFGSEQEHVELGEVLIYVHTLVNRDYESLAKVIDAVVGRLLVSTPMNSARIISASLSLDGLRRVGRVSGFDDAWEVVTQYRSPLVGVIAS